MVEHNARQQVGATDQCDLVIAEETRVGSTTSVLMSCVDQVIAYALTNETLYLKYLYPTYLDNLVQKINGLLQERRPPTNF